MTVDELTDLLPSVVPFVGKLGIMYQHMDGTGARLALKSHPSLLNHVGTVHAGVLFTLAESASGAVLVSGIGDLLDKITPVVTSAEITFHKAAVGDLVASAAPGDDLAGAVQAATTGQRSEVEVHANVKDSRDVLCVTALVRWVLLPTRQRVPEVGTCAS